MNDLECKQWRKKELKMMDLFTSNVLSLATVLFTLLLRSTHNSPISEGAQTFLFHLSLSHFVQEGNCVCAARARALHYRFFSLLCLLCCCYAKHQFLGGHEIDTRAFPSIIIFFHFLLLFFLRQFDSRGSSSCVSGFLT